MTAILLPLPRAVFYDANGDPLSGGKVHTYIPGGTVAKLTWQDAAETTPNANPITLDAAGSCLLYGDGNYNIVVTDSLGNSIPGYSGLTQTDVNQTSVASIAALRASSSGGSPVFVQGYYAAGDSGGGVFLLISTDTTSADNGGTVIVDSTGHRYYRIDAGDGDWSSAWFGMLPSLSDCTASWNTFAAALALRKGGAGAVILPGKYTFASAAGFTYPSSQAVFTFKVTGYGAILYWPHAAAPYSGMTFAMSSPMHSFALSGMHFTTGVANGGNGFAQTQSAPLNNAIEQSFRDVVWRGDDNTGTGGSFYWTNAVDLNNVVGANVTDCTIQGGNVSTGVFGGTGIAFIGSGPATNQESLFLNISGCFFFGLATAILYGAFVQVITFNYSDIVGCNLGIASAASEGGSLEEITVNGSDIECTSGCIALLTGVPFVQIMGTIFAGTANNATIWLPQCAGATIIGNEISVNSLTGSSGILIQNNTSPATIVGNNITGALFGVNLGTGSNSNTVVGNTILFCTTPVIDSGTSNYISNNNGVTAVHLSGAVGSSPWTYIAGSRPETATFSATSGITQIVGPDGGTLIPVGLGANIPITLGLLPHMGITITYTGTLTKAGSQL